MARSHNVTIRDITGRSVASFKRELAIFSLAILVSPTPDLRGPIVQINRPLLKRRYSRGFERRKLPGAQRALFFWVYPPKRNLGTTAVLLLLEWLIFFYRSA